MLDWKSVYDLTDLTHEACWHHCNSYCCTSNSPAFQFRFMRHNAAGMVFLQDELVFLRENNWLQEDVEASLRQLRLELSPGREVLLSVGYCGLGGLCTHPRHRPLICRLYPFFPAVDIESGTLTGPILSSVLDLYWESLGLEHPCYLVSDPERRRCAVQDLDKLSPLLKSPYFLFYFKAIELTTKRLVEDLGQSRPDLFRLEPSQFFARWEMLYLTGRAFDLEGLRQDLRQTDLAIRRKHGEYSLSVLA